jgi:hypothetical protein
MPRASSPASQPRTGSGHWPTPRLPSATCASSSSPTSNGSERRPTPSWSACGRWSTRDWPPEGRKRPSPAFCAVGGPLAPAQSEPPRRASGALRGSTDDGGHPTDRSVLPDASRGTVSRITPPRSLSKPSKPRSARRLATGDPSAGIPLSGKLASVGFAVRRVKVPSPVVRDYRRRQYLMDPAVAKVVKERLAAKYDAKGMPRRGR